VPFYLHSNDVRVILLNIITIRLQKSRKLVEKENPSHSYKVSRGKSCDRDFPWLCPHIGLSVLSIKVLRQTSAIDYTTEVWM
jgi:hypothetical protein